MERFYVLATERPDQEVPKLGKAWGIHDGENAGFYSAIFFTEEDAVQAAKRLGNLNYCSIFEWEARPVGIVRGWRSDNASTQNEQRPSEQDASGT